MTASTTDRRLQMRGIEIIGGLVGDAEELFAGTIVCRDATGYIVDGADSAALVFAGIARDAVDNSEGDDGDLSIDLYHRGQFRFAVQGGCDQADVGALVYVKDNNTVAKAADCDERILVGRIAEIVEGSSTEAWIEILPEFELPPEVSERSLFMVEVVGVDTTDFDLDDAAEEYGGTGATFYVSDVLHVHAFTTATAASAGLKVVTTDWTLADGVLTTVGDETATTWAIWFLGHLVRP